MNTTFHATQPHTKKHRPQPAIEPEFFRLPVQGNDPYFGLTRSYYYTAEQQGWIKLKRLRQAGKARGITLVPYQAVKAFLQQEDSHAR